MPLPISNLPTPFERHARRDFRCLVIALASLAIAFSVPVEAAAPNRFERLRQQDLRVASVAYRLSISSQRLCGEGLEPQWGFVVHGIAQYHEAARKGAGSNYRLDNHLGVMAVVAGSPADVGGLTANDRLISVNGLELSAGSDTGPGRAAAERAEKVIANEAKNGAVTLRVSGASGERDVLLSPVLGCPSRVEVLPGSEVNAWADGEHVVVTTAMLEQCQTDDELALVIAHEMAHNILRHRDGLASHGVSVSSLLPVSEAGSAQIRETEEEADRFAVSMAGVAGYDLGQAVSFLDRLLKGSGLGAQAAPTHPASDRRLALVRAAVATADSVTEGG